jgi:hypothetical protein
MPPNWLQQLEYIQPGEPVDAGVANRPSFTLDERTQYLLDLFNNAQYGGVIVDWNAAIAPNVQPGQPVFWDAAHGQYAQALAAVAPDPFSGTLTNAPSADVAGILWTKNGPNLGNILLAGVANVDLSQAVAGVINPGRYYLSSAAPGQLTLQRPPVSMPVLVVQQATSGTVYRVVVLPQLRNFLDDHIHYSFQLTCLPAGTVTLPATGQKHVIQHPNPNVPGWLPAEKEFFPGITIPHNAIFGYNLLQHPQLSQVWPPIPVTAVAAWLDKGQNHAGGALIPQGPPGLIQFTPGGIWWLSDCYGDVPWPTSSTGLATTLPALGSEKSSEFVDDCPRFEQMSLIVAFAKMVFATDKSVVTSLQPGKGSPITVTGCTGLAATTGDLFLGLNLQLLIDAAEAYGGQVLKTIGTDQHFQQGWVTEGIIAGSSNLQITSTHQRFLNPIDSKTPIVYQGLATLSVVTDLSAKILPPQIIRLNSAQERFYKGLPNIGLVPIQPTSFAATFNIPEQGLSNSPTATVRVVLFGKGNGTLPALTLTYRDLPRPVSAPQSLPTVDQGPVSFPSSVVVTTDNAIEINSAPIPVQPGDTLAVTLSRAGSDGYSAEIGVLRFEVILN